MDALRCARRSAVPLLIAAAVALPCGAAYADEGGQAPAGGTAAQVQAVQADAPADPLSQESAEGAGSAVDAGDKASTAGSDGASAADGQEPADSAADASASGSQGEGPSETSQASPSAGSDASADLLQPAKAASAASASVASAAPASAQAAPQAKAASPQRGWVESSGQVRYYDADGSAHTGWLVDSTYRSYGLQRYWFGSDGVLAKSRLVTKAEAGWWAYARSEGYVVRGRYADPSTGYVYLADNDGRLEGAGWVVSDSYGQGLQRYWVDSAAHAAKPGYSSDGWAHYTRPEGYVLRGSYAKSGLVYLADNDGRLAKSGWVVSSAYGQGLQRYWVDAAKHAAVVGYSSDGWAHYTTPKGYVLRGSYATGGLVYLADNDGRLAKSGWVVSSAYGQGLQRYWVDAAKHAAVVGYSSDGWAHYTTSKGYVLRGGATIGGSMYWANNDGLLQKSGWLVTDGFGQGLQRYWISDYKVYKGGFFKANGVWAYARSQGYVLRGKMRVGSGMLLADNDGVLVENIAKEGWLVTSLYDGELQRYRIDNSCSGHLGAHLDYFTIGGNDYYGRYDQGYVVRGYYSGHGTVVVADNDGCILRQLNGIDIHPDYQAGINFNAIDANFVIIKATQGTSMNLSSKASALADQALVAGKMIGFYHFVDTRKGAEAEAEYFYNAVKKYIGKAVLALDWENNDVSGQNNVSAGPAYAKRFLDRLYELSGVKGVIYMNRGVVHSYNWSSVANSGYKLWMAQYLYKYYDEDSGYRGYAVNPTIGSYSGHSSSDMGAWGSSPTLYQYTSTGVLNGYSGFLDFDVFYGNANQWAKLAARS